jgi:hypothetical protein
VRRRLVLRYLSRQLEFDVASPRRAGPVDIERTS